MSEADREVCRGFQCGNASFEREVADWIRREIWEIAPEWRALIPTILFFDAEHPEQLVGFGAWAHIEARSKSEKVGRHIEIAYLAVHSDYQGAKALSGCGCAEEIYATIYRDAMAHDDSLPDTPITLACHVDNGRARAFWTRQGFVKTEDIETLVPGSASDKYDRMVLGRRPASAPSATRGSRRQ